MPSLWKRKMVEKTKVKMIIWLRGIDERPRVPKDGLLVLAAQMAHGHMPQ